tara:strand:- start:190 stop:480 length:291 start_codon:yes stop_codon:yes gene_type:complete
MGLGFSEILTVAKLASDVLGDRKERGGSEKIEMPEFKPENYQRQMQKPQDAGEVKANEAVSYEDLTRMWDSILPNAYAEIIRTQEQPAYRSKKEIV